MNPRAEAATPSNRRELSQTELEAWAEATYDPAAVTAELDADWDSLRQLRQTLLGEAPGRRP